jgi:hypothetical protein
MLDAFGLISVVTMSLSVLWLLLSFSRFGRILSGLSVQSNFLLTSSLMDRLVLDNLGSLPYALARPILLKVDNPQKLVRHTPWLLRAMFANTLFVS